MCWTITLPSFNFKKTIAIANINIKVITATATSIMATT